MWKRFIPFISGENLIFLMFWPSDSSNFIRSAQLQALTRYPIPGFTLKSPIIILTPVIPRDRVNYKVLWMKHLLLNRQCNSNKKLLLSFAVLQIMSLQESIKEVWCSVVSLTDRCRYLQKIQSFSTIKKKEKLSVLVPT